MRARAQSVRTFRRRCVRAGESRRAFRCHTPAEKTRDRVAIMPCTSRFLRSKSAGTGKLEQLIQASGFGASDCNTKGGDAVIATAFVVVFGGGPLTSLGDQSLFEHALNGAIQRASAQLQFSTGAFGDILDDGVAVSIISSESHEDVESGGLERKQSFDFVVLGHAGIISTVDIASMGIEKCMG